MYKIEILVTSPQVNPLEADTRLEAVYVQSSLDDMILGKTALCE